MTNIEKSAFHRGEYVGYSAMGVWQVKKQIGFYAAHHRHDRQRGVIHADTLREMSTRLGELTK